jgi:2',3'-cyclic-nucleotide 2'-phosphodiesterase (5'-nucleotidase family)
MKKIFVWYLYIAFSGLFSIVPASDRYILYTSNINAMLQNCGCGQIKLGGLDRIKTFADSFLTEHSNAMIIDGGDFLNSYPFPELNRATLTALDRLNYTLIVPGEHEFVEGLQFFTDLTDRFTGKLLLSNAGMANGNRFIKEYRYNGCRFTAVLSPRCFDYIEKPEELQFRDQEQKKTGTMAEGMFEILIYHGLLSELEENIEKAPLPDLILLSHDQFLGMRQLNGIPVVGAGKDGEQVVVIRLGEGKKFDVDFIKITENLRPDPGIAAIIRHFEEETQ